VANIVVDIGQAIQQLQRNPQLGNELGKLLLKDVWTDAQNALNDAATMFQVTRAMVQSVLNAPGLAPLWSHREWTTQGLGMVRTNLDKDGMFRLNVWHHALRIPNISCIHTHPWDLKSYCLNGEITNVRYKDNLGSAYDYDPSAEVPELTAAYYPASYMTLGCGSHPNGAQLSGEQQRLLYPQEPEVYHTGDAYVQGRDEIHESRYVDGTVTLNVRTNRREDQSATVYWPAGTPWVDAKQRVATGNEVRQACDAALASWTPWPAQGGA
jgi:hypothetical protein